jgi:hypothetical protein
MFLKIFDRPVTDPLVELLSRALFAIPLAIVRPNILEERLHVAVDLAMNLPFTVMAARTVLLTMSTVRAQPHAGAG